MKKIDKLRETLPGGIALIRVGQGTMRSLYYKNVNRRRGHMVSLLLCMHSFYHGLPEHPSGSTQVW